MKNMWKKSLLKCPWPYRIYDNITMFREQQQNPNEYTQTSI